MDEAEARKLIFENITRRNPAAPMRKFALIKTFGRFLAAQGVDDPRKLSCAEIESVIERALYH
jgi:hypothetical protein